MKSGAGGLFLSGNRVENETSWERADGFLISLLSSRRSAELTEIEMCREESFFHQAKTLPPNCYPTRSFIKHLKGGWVQLVGGEIVFIVSLCVSFAAFSEEYTVSSGADCKWSPQASTRPSLLRSALTKAWLLQGGGSLCCWLVFSNHPLPTTCLLPKLWSHARLAQLPDPNFLIWYRLLCPLFWWNEV